MRAAQTLDYFIPEMNGDDLTATMKRIKPESAF
jgi:hypothetical protein